MAAESSDCRQLEAKLLDALDRITCRWAWRMEDCDLPADQRISAGGAGVSNDVCHVECAKQAVRNVMNIDQQEGQR
jgi:hypothetical protein